MGNALQMATCMPQVFVKASLIILQAHNYPQTHTYSCNILFYSFTYKVATKSMTEHFGCHLQLLTLYIAQLRRKRVSFRFAMLISSSLCMLYIYG